MTKVRRLVVSGRFSHAQSKLADLLMARRLADIADERAWSLLSIAAHPGYMRTNLQTAGASPGRETPRRSPLHGLTILPSQDVTQGAEPLLFAAADSDAVNGGYYGPGGRLGMVEPTTTARIPRRARDGATARRLWDDAERLTGVTLASLSG